MTTQRDYYEVLGASRNSSQEEIRAKFRHLALEYHPDRNKDPKALENFKEVNAAYQVLSDPQKRAHYDRLNHAGVGASNEYCLNGNHIGQGPICTRCGQTIAAGSNTKPSSKQERIDTQWYAVIPKDWGPPGSNARMHNSDERKMLYDILYQDEEIKAVVEGTYRADRSERDTDRLELHTIVAVATDRRVIFLDKGMFGFLDRKPDRYSRLSDRLKMRSEEVFKIPYSSIEGIAHNSGILSGGMRIAGLGMADLRVVDVLPKNSAKVFADCVRLQVQAHHVEATPQTVQDVHKATYVADELEKLVGLVKEGFLTRDEFEAKKKQLLGL